MPRRSKLEIYLDILKAVSKGKHKPTHIMYRANLAWERMKRLLTFLCSQGLLIRRENREGTRYEITVNGKEVLNYFVKLEYTLYHRRTAVRRAESQLVPLIHASETASNG